MTFRISFDAASYTHTYHDVNYPLIYKLTNMSL